MEKEDYSAKGRKINRLKIIRGAVERRKRIKRVGRWMRKGWIEEEEMSGDTRPEKEKKVVGKVGVKRED